MDENDSPTKPLTKRYAIYKSRVTRRAAWRDLRLTGQLLDGIKSRYADDQQAVADASGVKGRIKARVNRKLLQFSPKDQAAMSAIAEKYFGAEVSATSEKLTAAGRRAPFSRATFQRGAA